YLAVLFIVFCIVSCARKGPVISERLSPPVDQVSEGRKLMEAGEYDKAYDVLLEVARDHPDKISRFEARVMLADVIRLKKKYTTGIPGNDAGKDYSSAWPHLKEAEKQLKKMVLPPEQMARSLVFLGYAMFEIQKYEEAMSVFSHAASLPFDDSNTIQARMMMAKCLAYLDRKKEASDILARYNMTSSYSDNPTFLNALGQIYFDLEEYDRAESTLKHCYNMDPDDHECLEAGIYLAWVKLKKGKIENGLKLLGEVNRRLVKQFGKSPRDSIHGDIVLFGMVLNSVAGHKSISENEKAQFYLETAIEDFKAHRYESAGKKLSQSLLALEKNNTNTR
ncbi:MAG: hypothetical protein J7M18_03700, partial [Candidatus Eremiobacteraeota bacterium]|nr:hypothetical protein [Candidatus Eremiobacteraeota bacterium]